MERAGLSELFDHDPPYLMTLFAFNDTAYNNLPENERNVFENYTKNQLADYIKFCTGKLLIYNIDLTNRRKTKYMFYPMNKRNLVNVQQWKIMFYQLDIINIFHRLLFPHCENIKSVIFTVWL